MIYYARALCGTMLPASNQLVYQKALPTEITMQQAFQLLDYVATYQNAFLRFTLWIFTEH